MTDNESLLVNLIRAAVELAIVRHDLAPEGDEGNDLDGPMRRAIADDAWKALSGVDTCHGEIAPELTAVLGKMRP